jgi:hypothetical protein
MSCSVQACGHCSSATQLFPLPFTSLLRAQHVLIDPASGQPVGRAAVLQHVVAQFKKSSCQPVPHHKVIEMLGKSPGNYANVEAVVPCSVVSVRQACCAASDICVCLSLFCCLQPFDEEDVATELAVTWLHVPRQQNSPPVISWNCSVIIPWPLKYLLTVDEFAARCSASGTCDD